MTITTPLRGAQVAASPPLCQPGRAPRTVPGRSSSLKGRFAIAARRPCGPPLTLEPLRPRRAANTGRPGPARTARVAQQTITYKIKVSTVSGDSQASH
jgi:hypothetical protein